MYYMKTIYGWIRLVLIVNPYFFHYDYDYFIFIMYMKNYYRLIISLE